jgi:hypothetical protein
MNCRTTIKAEEATVNEIALALAGVGDRGVWIDGIRTGKAE